MGLLHQIKQYFHNMIFTVKSLSHDSSRPTRAYFDAMLEPLYWFIDKFTRYIGLLMVIMVIILTTSVVVFWYKFLLPTISTYSQFWFWYHCIVSHYLLINVVFHYFKAVSTSAGVPPQHLPMEDIKGAVVCKHCVQPKPPRTHHCSICDSCFLKMDHHCPWMNNCIGHFNHRYFVSFCIFMWFGTVYVSSSSFDLFTYHFGHPGVFLDPKKLSKILLLSLGFGDVLEQLFKQMNIHSKFFQKEFQKQVDAYRPHPGRFSDAEIDEWEHIGIIYLFLLTIAVTVALGMLNCYHLWLVSRGETSIEVHINKTERRKAAQRGMGYNNPYNHGRKNNFRFLFGLNGKRGIMSVLLPSSHLPDGDGLSWPNNKKPVHYPDPKAYERYEEAQKRNLFRKICPC
ncbi:palmitoyltransferase ZDHHC16B-like [Clytia hemisphaerica]|uniref:Palmitoyltransferase n=1 Tax=Clytia hemisphaerica TaxID=252671 RepID=A0A7M5V4V9_9CNID